MAWLITCAYLGLQLFVAGIFYIRMSKVGSLLGGNYKLRMKVALTLLVIIPISLSFLSIAFQMIKVFSPSLNIDTSNLFAVLSVAILTSFVAGAMLLPGVLISALSERRSDEVEGTEILVEEPSFEDRVEAIRNRIRSDREASNKANQAGTR